MGVMRSGHFWQLGSIASLATETTGGEILHEGEIFFVFLQNVAPEVARDLTHELFHPRLQV